MTGIPKNLSVPAMPAGVPGHGPGLHIFADGCHEPRSGQGGWAFIVYRDMVEIARDCGGVDGSANNATELMAVLRAILWTVHAATGETAVIWSDSRHAVQGCNSWRHVWRNNGWRKTTPNARRRKRTVANRDIWEAIDRHLSCNPWLTVAWCKGHSGIDGNERADALADQGRLSIREGGRP